jgi:hypothetical protein
MTYHFKKYVTKYHHFIIHLIKEGHFGILSLFVQFFLNKRGFSYLFNFPMNRSNIDPQQFSRLSFVPFRRP